MVKVLSFDVGIRNLAYCLLEKNSDGVKILEWDVIDLVGEIPEEVPKCDGTLKNGKECTHKCANVTEEGDHYCNMHLPDDVTSTKYFAPKICSHEIAKKGNCKRKVFYQNAEKKYYCKIHGKKINGLNVINKDPSYYELCKMISQKIEETPALMDVDDVVIENQPTMKNPRMKNIQVMLFSHFVMRDKNNRIKNVNYISATNKLKEAYKKVDVSLHKMPANAKAQRKKLAIIYTKELLQDQPDKLHILENHSKKDDMCDSYLQGLYYINK